MKFDVLGRIGNMRLPDGKTALLYSIYEAVSNAIQAIEERFGRAEFAKRGMINVLIELNTDKSLKFLAISDNGIGLNPTHLASFETCDTRQKYSIGGKGVGRLIWVKVFDEIQVRSTFEVGLDRHEQVSFKFDPNLDNSLVGLTKTKGEAGEVGTRIMLTGIKPDQNAGITRPIIARNICHHFFPYFIAGSMPRLNVMFGRRELDIGEYGSSAELAKAEKVNDSYLSRILRLRLIDCESFQWTANGKRFACEVGVETFTPPELQGKNFREVIRTINHDSFGLAVMVFLLLFMGRHPFAGRFLGRGDMPIPRAISEFRFAYSAMRADVQMDNPIRTA